MNRNSIITTLIFLLIASGLQAKVNIGIPNTPAPSSGKLEAGDCNPSVAQIDLEINNVRARILTGGDLWWDPVGANPHYEVPRVPPGSDQPSFHSIFAGALWLGGVDQLGQLKVAAQTYRQSGNDFWPGPLDDNGQVEQAVCNSFDKFFEVRGTDIDQFLGTVEENDDNGDGIVSLSESQVPESILNWPGRNNPFFDEFALPINKNLAPFIDVDDDGVYNPTVGDYPVIDPDCGGVYADQMIWWIVNDRGNVHTETGGEAIGVEIGGLAFAFATNDEVNNMTFYRYVVDNKSTQPLDSVYFGQWVDPDLGQFDDDYVGCVPEEGLGIVYNGDAVDGDYGNTPPMLGVDFFEGPKKIIGFDENDDPIFEELGMTAFVYYNNDFSITGNPENAAHFYGYLAGVWKDGTPFTCGGNGYGGSDPSCNYIFPGQPNNPDTWSECSENNVPFDRRFLQSSGPFRLEPGAVNNIIVGAVWVQDGLNYPCPSFDPLIQADNKAQALFDNCFELLDGPDAPTITIRELDQELVLSLWNDEILSNNAFEEYAEKDPVLASQGFADSLYRFQGYKVYQLSGVTVSPAEFSDPDKARLIATVDIKDGVGRLLNWTTSDVVGTVLVPEEVVNADDTGIRNTFRITEDLFAEGDKRLINNTKYYFAAVAYSYNSHEPYDPANPSPTAQLTPYLEGRNNIGVYTGIPHIPTPQQNGITLNAEYGDGPEVTRVSGGFGSGGNQLELTDETTASILADGAVDAITYQGAAGPIGVTVVDPMRIPNADFRLTLTNVGEESTLADSSKWILENITTGDVYVADKTIGEDYEQGIGGWNDGSLGFVIRVDQPELPNTGINAPLTSSLTFSDNQRPWLSLISDAEGLAFNNWIRSGVDSYDDNGGFNDNWFGPGNFYDPDQYYETILDGRIAPYCLSNGNIDVQTFIPPLAPACSDCGPNDDPTFTLTNLASVDIIFTSDKSLWTQCVVVEMSRDEGISEGNAIKNSIREHPSWDKDSNTYTEAVSATTLSPNTRYYVSGDAFGSGITYTDGTGTEVSVLGGNFFETNNISAAAAYTLIGAAELFNASDIGVSWFPGYAINVETGERLNMMFSESSSLGTENGKDMLWNPTSNLFSPSFSGARFGGEHFVYVMESRYDNGQAYQEALVDAQLIEDSEAKTEVYNEAMWVMLPILNSGFNYISVDQGLIPTDVTIKARVATPYQQLEVENPNLVYEFSFSDLAPDSNDEELAKSAIDLVQVVPNPYYAFSSYETSQLDNRIKITNLPARANISIFTLEGILVRSLAVDNIGANGNFLDTALGARAGQENINTLDWDLRNQQGIPIASGVYLIHVEAPTLGEERTLKFFCIKRPVDLDIF